MYLSRLILCHDPPSKAALRDLASPYEMHRTILRAFPDAEDGGPGRVLFRLELSRPDRAPAILIQSEKHPDFSALEAVPGYHLSAETKALELRLRPGQRLRFRLRANPTVKRDGKRHGLLKDEDQRRWLERKGELGGFRPLDFITHRRARVVSRKPGAQGSQVHLAVDFDGLLEVTDPDRFVETLAAGIGAGKAFGFGLLSVAPP